MTATDYESRRLARIERLRQLSQKAAQASNAACDQAMRILEHIPPGQPILVGHHSERRHRRDLDRIDRAMRRSVEAQKKAGYYARRVAVAEANRTIYSYDPNALPALRQKLAELQERHARMKAEPRLRGHSLALSNSNGNIRRVKLRIAALERAATADKTPIATGPAAQLTRNPLTHRLELRFTAKPTVEVMDRMKAAGWLLRRLCGEWFWVGYDSPQDRAFAAALCQ